MEPRRRAAPESPTLGPAHDVGVIKFSTLPAQGGAGFPFALTAYRLGLPTNARRVHEELGHDRARSRQYPEQTFYTKSRLWPQRAIKGGGG